MKIDSLLICGGTHGNELTGVYAVKHWLEYGNELKSLAPSVNADFLLVNQAAIEARTRFIDEDLNRQFDLNKLADNAHSTQLNLESALAQTLQRQFGPKTSPKLDFIIDIHNTTSAMGPTLIVLEGDDFTRNMARYVKTHMPSANILVEDHVSYLQHPYFCTLAKRSVMIEIGPQAQGALRAKAFQQCIEMTEHLLSFIEQANTNELPILAPVQAFRLITEVAYPTNSDGKRSAMIHPNLDGNDFEALHSGEACFIDFHGDTICWEGTTVYPHFIGEAAYDKQGLAFATAQLCSF